MRLILLVHRYLAVTVGVLMALWCLSGFVMMYQAYPNLTEAERLGGLEPLDLDGCCKFEGLALPDAASIRDFRIEMLRGDPVLRLSGAVGPNGPVPGALLNLRTGEPIGVLSADQAADVARQYGERHAIRGAVRALGVPAVDQWTILDARRNQPVYHFAFDDRAGTEIYVSGVSGEVFQDTDRRERVLAWLGAIPHWLYPLQLRQNGPLWTQIVIWTSTLGTFLTLTGLAVGIWRFKPRAEPGRRSPFRGWWYWHHMSGLAFGVLTLTWVFSGLMTMDPWGVLFGGGGPPYAAEIRGRTTWGDLKRFLASAGPQRRVTQLRAAPFDGRLYVLAVGTDGGRMRLDASGRPARPIDRTGVAGALARHDIPVAGLALLERADSFYYGSSAPGAFPVYRAVLDDSEDTRLYIHPVTGAIRAFDAGARASRWIVDGLHDFDFPVLRSRPLWDVVVVLLLAGVTAVCMTGTWLAFKRVRLDLRRVRRRLVPVRSRSTSPQL